MHPASVSHRGLTMPRCPIILSPPRSPNPPLALPLRPDPARPAEDCSGLKTRRYDNIRAEVEAFFDVHDAMGSVPGGLHLEMTGAPAGCRALALGAGRWAPGAAAVLSILGLLGLPSTLCL